MRSPWLLVALLGCASSEPPTQPAAAPTSEAANAVSAANVGKRITLEGVAMNRKGGAVLVGEGFQVWMADFDAWPDGFYEGGDRGKRLVVTAELGEDHGLPIVVERPGEPIAQGIPVPEGTDVHAASHRFVLKNATWTAR